MRGVCAGILATVLLVSILGPLAATESSDDRALSHEDEEFESRPRTVEVDVGGDRVEFRSIGAEGDRLRIEFRAQDGELRLDFTVPENNTVEVQLRLTVEALMEYMDGDESGNFDVGEEVVQTLEVDEMPFEVGLLEAVDDGYIIGVDYFLQETDLLFGLTFWIFGNDTPLEGAIIHPTEVKFDVGISFFPFERELSSLALVVEMQTEVEPRANFTGTEVELEAVGDRYEGFFRWNKMAEVDETPATVGSAVIKRETEFEGGLTELEVERTVVLSYPHGTTIFHDPAVGVAAVPILPPPPPPPEEPTPIPPLNVLTYGIMLGFSSLFVVATLLARRRKSG
ncbi:MAG: hypothetical protein ACE5HJ_01675 [Thermoplasmata archaeon]